MKKFAAMLAAVSAAVAVEAGAAVTPLEVSLFCPPLSIPWCDDVSGLRLDLLSGVNRRVSGLDIGTLVNIAEEEASGLQLCGFYNHIGVGDGLLQFAGLLNRCDSDYLGVQFAAVYNEIGGTLSGASAAAMNVAKSVQGGLQFGVFNSATVLSGLQFGIVNYAEDADRGVQVGLVNVMPNADIPVSVVVNIGF